jgi:hypothetical protein
MGRNSITKRLREQNRAEKAERKVAKRQERKVQQAKLPVDSAGERIEPPALLLLPRDEPIGAASRNAPEE